MFVNRGLLDFLEIDVGDVVAVVAGVGVGGVGCACAGVGTGLGLCVEDVLLGFAELGFDVLDGGVDGVEVLALVGFLEAVEGALDSGLLVGGNLVAEFAELFLGLEDDGVGLVELVDTLFFLGVGSCVGFGFFLHALDFGVGEAAGCFDADALLLAGGLVLGADVEDAVCVNLEGYLNLRYAAGCGRDAVEVELAEEFVVLGHGALALEDVDFHAGLVVGCGGECLALAGRNGGVGFDELGHDAAEGLDAYAQRHNVEQKHVLDVAAEHAALDGCAYGYDFVGVDALVGLLAEEVGHGFLHGGDTGGAADEDYFVDVLGGEAGVAEGILAGLDGGVDELVGELLELGAGERLHEVLGHPVDGHDVGEVDFGAGGAGELDFGFLGSFLEALEGHGVLAEVDAFVLEEFVGEPVDDYVVEVVAAEVGVAVGALNFEHAVAELEDGDIECAAAEVEYGNLLVLVGLVEAVGKGCCGGFVDDTLYGEACDFAGFLGGLALGVVEVGWHGDDGFGDALSEVVFGGLLHFLKNHCGDFLGSVFASVDVDAGGIVVAAYHTVGHALDFVLNLVVGFAHEALDGVDGALGVGDGLALGGFAHFTLAAVDECYDGRSGVAAFGVGDYNGVVAFKNCDAGVGGS